MLDVFSFIFMTYTAYKAKIELHKTKIKISIRTAHLRLLRSNEFGLNLVPSPAKIESPFE